ncbi:pyruvate phosphate dikinase PEP/pyruvate-binding domain protein [Bacteriovorax sp. DB6_IX]|uniref:pyruvate phosphate dikinase PEP/pyruvate-binding domain protein n=1 Tax=Bacteriovorax sp. DB6_IX TaxID=1353530 RepID=UPI00038A426C|nr:pyruvate phosphate dikinase PEP/pyruvate-binding domain protein [Bacteriovorax sp. DB6_IX]EQC50738.1 pyruvate phosphate dikinase, PEP/pyruvate-binding domain protein [Bacteriovorax sp. DB6_IX]
MMFLSDKLDQRQRDSLGKKAGNLVELMSANTVIPDGFILRYEDFSKGLVEAKLLESIKRIGGFPVAVRSSGQLEDLGDMSFAGLYETFLYIDSVEALVESIKKCFDSSQGNRVREYLAKADIEKSESELYEQFSVLVQKMVDPECAGVAFSVNPLDGIEDHMLLEVCEGVGEHLVSGEVTPNQYIYHYQKNEIIDQRIENEKARLSGEELKEIANELLNIQAHFGCPQDIEWALDSQRKLWILQARPITTIEWRKDLGELTNADLKDGGISSAVCTPLMFSLYRKGMNESMPGYFKKLTLLPKEHPEQWLFACYGRAYWSAGEVKKMLKSIPGYNEKSFDEDLGIMKDYGSQGPDSTGLNPFSLLRAIPVLMGMEKEFKKCHEENSNFESFFGPLEENYHKLMNRGLSTLSEKDFQDELIFIIKILFLQTETSYYRTIYNNSNLQSMFKEFIEKIEKRVGDKINTIQLLSNLDGVAHLEIQKDLAKVSAILHESDSKDDTKDYKERLDQAVAVFLKKHFHHGDRELDITVERWGEIPQRVVEMAQDYRELDQSKVIDSYQREYQRVKELILSNGGFFSGALLKKFEKKLAFVRSYLMLREKMREYSTRSYYIVRQFILELDRRWEVREMLSFFILMKL